MQGFVHQNLGSETLLTGADTDEQCAPKWCSFKSLDHPDPITHEEPVYAYHLAPYFFQI